MGLKTLSKGFKKIQNRPNFYTLGSRALVCDTSMTIWQFLSDNLYTVWEGISGVRHEQ